MAYENILYEVGDQGIARITFNRPKKLNALNDQTIREFQHALLQAGTNEKVRGILVTGAGDKAFIAGADIEELAKMGAMDGKQKSTLGQGALNMIETLGKPTVAAINGFALGGGFELAMACTLRTASTSARVGLPEVTLGIIPGYGGTQRLARLAGPGVAREWTLTGELYSAEEAHRVGVVNRLYKPEELLPETEKLLSNILNRGPVAVRFAMEAISRGGEMSLAEGQKIEADLFGIIATTADMKEGMTAFLEKRKPNFQGK